MERFCKRACWACGIEEGSERVMKWVWREGRRVGRTLNQWAERRLRSRPLDGIP